MTPERWQQITEILESALGQPPGNRGPFLDGVCAGDAELRAEVESLLSEHERMSGFLNRPALESTTLAEEFHLPEINERHDHSAARASLNGTLLKGRYRIERELGSGGVGIVYLARDEQLHSRLVVVKALQDDSFRNPWFQKKFLQEIEALSRLDHPAIVSVSDTGEMPDGKLFYVMQYVEGHTLRSEIRPGGLDLKRAGQIVLQISQALTAAHEKGILHLDLKPTNVMIQEWGGGELRVKLIDFGVARIKDPGFKGTTDLSSLSGTPDYMAPEQVLGKASAASDVYALGLIAYELVTGRRFLKVQSPLGRAEGEGKETSPPPRKVRPALPFEAQNAILKALAPEPDQRFDEARTFAEAFLNAFGTVESKNRHSPISRKWAAVAACVAIVLALVGWRSLIARRSATAADREPVLRRIAKPRLLLAGISPDGQQMAGFRPGTGQLWVDNLKTGDSRQLIAEEIRSDFTWSPSSQEIALVCRGLGGKFSRVEVVSVQSAARRVIFESPEFPPLQGWLPDGSQLVCRRDLPDSRKQIEYLSLADGRFTPVLQSIALSKDFQISPNGRFIAYSAAHRNDNWDIFVRQVSDGESQEIQLTDDVSPEGSPIWSPTGNLIYYARSGDLWGIQVDSETGRPAAKAFQVATLGLTMLPGWVIDPEGDLIYLNSKEQRPRIGHLEFNAETGLAQKEKLGSEPEASGPPFWSADGSRYYYHSGSSGALVETKLSTGEQRLIRIPDGFTGEFREGSPDGQSFVFWGWKWSEASKTGIFEFFPAQRKTVFLSATNAQNWLRSSPDGQELLCVAYLAKENRHAVRIWSRSTGSVRDLVRTPTQPHPEWSPDGREIAFTNGECLNVINREGGTARQIVCAQKADVAARGRYLMAGQLGWSSDGGKLAWTVHNQQEQRMDLWIVDYFSGKTQIWLGEKDYESTIAFPSWSPDGREIAFQKYYAGGLEVWKLSNFQAADQ